MLQWKKIKGSNVKPEEVDTTSSAMYVYLRRNIVEVANDNFGQDIPVGNPTTHYEWEEAKVSQLDYFQNLKTLDSETLMAAIQERDARIELLAQSVSELELTVAENNIQ